MFTTNPIQLSKLLNEIDDGEMQLPEFQRGGFGMTSEFAIC